MIRRLHLFALLALLSISCSTQKIIFKDAAKEKIEFKKIIGDIRDTLSSNNYSSLIARLDTAYRSLSLSDYRHLYYGYQFIENKETSNHKYFNLFDISEISAKEAPTGDELQKLAEYYKCQIEKNPADIRSLKSLSNVYAKLKESDNEEMCKYKAQAFTEAILSTGDGLSKSSAYLLNSEEDESVILEALKYKTSGSVSYRGNYKAVGITSDAPNEIFFDIGTVKETMEYYSRDFITEGNKLCDNNKYEEALNLYRCALEIGQVEYVIFNNIGNAYGCLKIMDSCYKYLNLSIAKNNEYELAWRSKLYYLGKENKNSEIIKCADSALKLFPNNASILTQKGMAEFDLKLFSKSLETLIQAKDNCDNPVSTSYNYSYIARAYQELRNNDSAFYYYSLSIACNQDISYPLYNRGRLYYKLAEFNKAIADFSQITTLDSTDWEAELWEARAYSEIHEFDSAIYYTNKAAELANDDKRISTSYFVNYIQKSEFDSAIFYANYQQKDSLVLYNDMAIVYILKNDWERAKIYIDSAYALDTTAFLSIFKRGLYYYYIGDTAKGKTEFSKILYSPLLGLIRNNCDQLVTIRHSEDKWSYNMLEEFSQIKDKNAKLSAFRGFAKLHFGLRYGYENDFADAQKKYKNTSYFQIMQAIESYKHNDTVKFEEYINKAIETNKYPHKLLLETAALYYSLNSFDKALDYVDRALALQPDLELAENLKDAIVHCKDSAADATIYLNMSYEANKDSKNIDVLFHLVTSLENQKKFDKCVEIFDKMIALDTNDYGMIYHKALFLSTHKRMDETTPLLDLVLAKNPYFFPALNIKAVNYFSKNEYDSAAAIVERIINNQGMILNDFHPFAPVKCYAIRKINSYYKNDENRKEFYYRIIKLGAAVNARNRNYKKAIDYGLQYINYQDNANVRCDIAFSSMASKRYPNAINHYQKALLLNDKIDYAWYNLACVYSLTNQADLAIDALKRAIELSPKNKYQAKKDNDFDLIRSNAKFIELLK